MKVGSLSSTCPAAYTTTDEFTKPKCALTVSKWLNFVKYGSPWLKADEKEEREGDIFFMMEKVIEKGRNQNNQAPCK